LYSAQCKYTNEVQPTLDYFADNSFHIYLQWLNPGYNDETAAFDHLGLVPRILSTRSALSIRDGSIVQNRAYKNFVSTFTGGLDFAVSYVTLPEYDLTITTLSMDSCFEPW